MNSNNTEKNKDLEIKSHKLGKSGEIETIVDNYIRDLIENKEIFDLFQYSKEMANIIIFLAENDRDGILFTLITDYLSKIIDRGKIRRQEKGI